MKPARPEAGRKRLGDERWCGAIDTSASHAG